MLFLLKGKKQAYAISRLVRNNRLSGNLLWMLWDWWRPQSNAFLLQAVDNNSMADVRTCQLRMALFTRWFKYDWDDLCVNKSQFVPVIFEPPCIYWMVLK
jgi:hypothetical protein